MTDHGLRRLERVPGGMVLERRLATSGLERPQRPPRRRTRAPSALRRDDGLSESFVGVVRPRRGCGLRWAGAERPGRMLTEHPESVGSGRPPHPHASCVTTPTGAPTGVAPEPWAWSSGGGSTTRGAGCSGHPVLCKHREVQLPCSTGWRQNCEPGGSGAGSFLAAQTDHRSTLGDGTQSGAAGPGG